jgi:hypothetical protein
VLSRIHADGSPISVVNELPGFDEFTSLVGMDEIQDIARRFGNG